MTSLLAALGLVFLAELGRTAEARGHFEKARTMARTEPERRLMERRLALSSGPRSATPTRRG